MFPLKIIRQNSNMLRCAGFVVLLLAQNIILTSAQTATYKASIRGLQDTKNTFLQINEKTDTAAKCRTETANKVREYDFYTSCSVSVKDVEILRVELRDNVKAGKDKHMGWAYVCTRHMLKPGTITAEFWDSDSHMGTLRITISSVT